MGTEFAAISPSNTLHNKLFPSTWRYHKSQIAKLKVQHDSFNGVMMNHCNALRV